MLQEASDRTSEHVQFASVDVEQSGALCLGRSAAGAIRILLVASKRNGRWGLPKGHIELGETSSVAAEREAFEEAGALGVIESEPIGSFVYFKDSSIRRYRVTVHLMNFASVSGSYPERATRKSQWFSLDRAIAEAGQPGLRTLLRQLP